MLRSLALAIPLLLSSQALRAQERLEDEPGTFSGERLRPALDRAGLLDVEWAGIDTQGTWDAALWVGYAYNPLVLNQRLNDGSSVRVGSLIGHRVGTSVVASMALLEWLELGGELPLVLLQSRGDGVPGLALRELQGFGVGDARLAAKVQVLRAREQFVDLAIIPAITVPTGFPFNSYMGEGFFSFIPEVAVSRELLGFRLGANVGARFRPDTEFFGLNVGHELTWRVGAGYRLSELTAIPIEVQASLNGGASLIRPLGRVNTMPMELLAGVAWEAIPDLVQVTAGGGVGIVGGFGTPDARLFAAVRLAPRDRDRDKDGILDDVDQCPDDPEDKDGWEDSDGCPDPDNDGDGLLDHEDRCPNNPGPRELFGCPEGDRDGDGIPDVIDKCPDDPEDIDQWQDEDGCPDPDNDGDGILDVDDKCPNEPEDMDGFEDHDGCPEDDNDGDGILDVNDQCPDEPEDFDGDEDEDGCPDNARIVVTKKKVFALEKIYFEFAKADIKRESFGILDEVARVLLENPEIGRVRVEGHTDSVGSDEYNQILSQARVESVRRYLIKKKVSAERLEAVGFGESKPIATNDTPEGREKNRRVEFVLIDQASAAP
jgi:outer membrane protein OmpA-like peptidoglycan-associated protein